MATPEDGGSMYFRNFGMYAQVHGALLPTRPASGIVCLSGEFIYFVTVCQLCTEVLRFQKKIMSVDCNWLVSF